MFGIGPRKILIYKILYLNLIINKEPNIQNILKQYIFDANNIHKKLFMNILILIKNIFFLNI